MKMINNSNRKSMLNSNRKRTKKRRKSAIKNPISSLKAPKEQNNPKKMRKIWKPSGAKRSSSDNSNSKYKCLFRIALSFQMVSKVKLKASKNLPRKPSK